MPNIPHELSLLIRRSATLPQLLDSTVELVAREMGTDVCSIYLLDPRDHRLRLMATRGLDKEALGKVVLAMGEGLTGLAVAELRSLAVEDASTHPGYRYFPETREEQFHSFLGVPMAIRNRPVGAIVVQTREKRKYSEDEIATLTTISAQLVGVVENARLVQALDQGEKGRAYLHEIRAWNGERFEEAGTVEGEVELQGVVTSPGVVIGKALFRGSYDLRFTAREEPFQGIEREATRLAAAIEKTREDIQRIQEAAQREADEEHALIFSSHLLFLNDVALRERVDANIRAGMTAPRALFDSLATIERQLLEVRDTYIQERVEDIRDLRNRILSHLLEESAPTTRLGETVVVTANILPSLVVELKAQGARAIITEHGSRTSHGALLARSMGIPAVTGVSGIVASVCSGDTVIVDGGEGKVIVRPTEPTIERFRDAEARIASNRRRMLGETHKASVSFDGVRVPLLANIGVGSDLGVALEVGAEGVGLYRTEFPFLIREGFPTREEQVRIYRRVYEAFPQGPVYCRSLDLGGDKFLVSLARTPEPNPELGYRSLRLLLDHTRVFQDQIQAFLRAAQGAKVRILLPMVGSIGELEKAKTLIREAIDELEDNNIDRSPLIGAMIELPGAVEIAQHIARRVSFLSIGSNDLTQFTLAVDRENERVAAYNDPHHPAVLRLIHRTIEAGHRARIPVGICGEMAAEPRMAAFLVALGIDSLSLGPNAIPEVKEFIRRSAVLPLRAEIGRILELPEASAIREELATRLP